MLYYTHLTLEEEVTEECWAKAFENLEKQIVEVPDVSSCFNDFDFSDLVIGVLFLFEQVGVREIKNIFYFANAFQTLWRRHRDGGGRKAFYPDKIFYNAYNFDDKRGIHGKILFEEVLLLRLTRDNSLGLCLGLNKNIAEVHWQYFLELADRTFARLKKKKNKKYIICIFEVAKDLLNFLSQRES